VIWLKCRFRVILRLDGAPFSSHASPAAERSCDARAAGADPNIADRDGIPPLAHAWGKGQKGIAEMIGASGGRIAR
jgi:hypothetical protein